MVLIFDIGCVAFSRCRKTKQAAPLFNGANMFENILLHYHPGVQIKHIFLLGTQINILTHILQTIFWVK